jgi:hypothetical protein
MKLKNNLIILLTITLLFLSINSKNLDISNATNRHNIIKVTKDTFSPKTKGEKLFTKKLQKYCEISGGEFALRYSQDEWEEIAEAGEFDNVTLEICPKLKNIYQAKWTPTLYKFAYMYASDSGNIPSS